MTEVLELVPDEIEVPADRLRAVDAARVSQMAHSMRDVGQIAPIEVSPADGAGRHRLIAGAHRLAAVREAGLAAVRAIVFQGTPDEVRLHEIDENLYRHELSPLDQAAFLAERRAVYERLYGPVREGASSHKRNCDKLSQLKTRNDHLPPQLTFFEDISEKFGLQPRFVQRALARRYGIRDDIWVRLRGSRLATRGTELDALARLSEPMQARVVDLLLSGEADAPRSVSAALRRINGEPAPTSLSKFGAFQALWKRMTAEEREQVRVFVRRKGER